MTGLSMEGRQRKGYRVNTGCCIESQSGMLAFKIKNHRVYTHVRVYICTHIVFYLLASQTRLFQKGLL